MASLLKWLSTLGVLVNLCMLPELHRQLFLVVGVGGVEGSGRVVTGDAVFCDQGGHIGFGIAVEETVVSHAEADHYVEIGLGLVQETGLEDGVAHCGTYFFALRRDAYRSLGTAFDFADHGVGLEAVGSEDSGEDSCFVDKAYAVGYTDLAGSDLTGEFHYFLYAGKAAIAFIFHFGTGYHYVVVSVLVISFECPSGVFFRKVCGQTEVRICLCLEFAVLCAAIDAA